MKDIVYEEVFRNELTHAWYLGTRQLMLRNLHKFVGRNSNILDAGCGTGGTTQFLKKNGFNNIIGIDSSQIAIKYAKRRGIKNLKLGSVNKLPFQNNTFDVIICLDVLYHKKVNPPVALKEFNRVLKKKGIIYIQEPSYSFLESNHDTMIETGRRFTAGKIKNLTIKSGFIVKKSTYFNSMFLLPILVKRIIEKIISKKVVGSDVQPLPRAINKIYLKILQAEAYLINYFNLPFGLSIVLIGQKP